MGQVRSSPAFLAVARRLRGPADEAAGRDAVVDILRGQGKQLRSTLLMSLASRIAADPLAKVKTLIQELVERLLQEAANEANQKGWCDKALSDAKQRRDYASEEVQTLNAEMAKLEALTDNLKEALATLSTDIGKLEDSREKAEKERGEEKQENEETVEEATLGLEALNKGTDLLDKF